MRGLLEMAKPKSKRLSGLIDYKKNRLDLDLRQDGFFSVSKKSNYKFRHAGRLLRNGVEFRILRGKMYEGTSTEQKAKNAKNRLNSMFNLFFIPSATCGDSSPLLHKRGANMFSFGVVQPTLSTV